MNPADLVERLREDANGLRQAVSQASFASDTYVRVKQPDLLIAVLNEAADEIERLRAALVDIEKLSEDGTAAKMISSAAFKGPTMGEVVDALDKANRDWTDDDLKAALKEATHEPG